MFLNYLTAKVALSSSLRGCVVCRTHAGLSSHHHHQDSESLTPPAPLPPPNIDKLSTAYCRYDFPERLHAHVHDLAQHSLGGLSSSPGSHRSQAPKPALQAPLLPNSPEGRPWHPPGVQSWLGRCSALALPRTQPWGWAHAPLPTGGIQPGPWGPGASAGCFLLCARLPAAAAGAARPGPLCPRAWVFFQQIGGERKTKQNAKSCPCLGVTGREGGSLGRC